MLSRSKFAMEILDRCGHFRKFAIASVKFATNVFFFPQHKIQTFKKEEERRESSQEHMSRIERPQQAQTIWFAAQRELLPEQERNTMTPDEEEDLWTNWHAQSKGTQEKYERKADDSKRIYEEKKRAYHAPDAPKDAPLVGNEPYSNASEYAFYLGGLTEGQKLDHGGLWKSFQEDFKTNKAAYEAKMAVARTVHAENTLAYWSGNGTSVVDVMETVKVRIAAENAGGCGGDVGGLPSSAAGLECSGGASHNGTDGDSVLVVSAEAEPLFADCA